MTGRAIARWLIAVAVAVAGMVAGGDPGRDAAAAPGTSVVKKPVLTTMYLAHGELTITEEVVNIPPDRTLGAFSVRFTYPSATVQVTVEEGPFLRSTGRSTSCFPTGGNDFVGLHCASAGMAPGPTGSGVLAYIRVRPQPGVVLKPTLGNGVLVVLDNDVMATGLADPLGDPITVSEVGDAAVVLKALEGDLNRDCAVNVLDEQAIASRFGSSEGSLAYAPYYDLEPPLGDGDIDTRDLQFVFGRHGTQCDVDADGVGDLVDNCLYTPNASQVNTDAAIDNGPGIPGHDTTVPNGDPTDREGDACETDGDIDNDGLPDAQDTNPLGSTGACAAFAGASDGHPSPAGGDVTNDDNGNGTPAPPMGTDVADNGPSWDTDNDGVPDGTECALGTNPRNAGSRPSLAACGGMGDSDGDGLPNAWETCGWGTNPLAVDSDGDGRGDCREAADVDGNGVVDFIGDVVFYAKAALLPTSTFGKTMDFDIDKNGVVDFVSDVLQEGKLTVPSGRCQ